MLKLRPPTHRADALGIFIAPQDQAWDNDRWRADMTALEAAALTRLQDAAEAELRATGSPSDEAVAEVRAACRLTEAQAAEAHARHPAIRYLRGLTRYQPGADDWDPEGKPCTVRDRYLRPGAAEFTIRRLPFATYQAAIEISSPGERLTAFARAGLRAIKSPEWTWSATGEHVPDDVMQALHDADPSLLRGIGQAVFNLCQPLTEAELFRSA